MSCTYTERFNALAAETFAGQSDCEDCARIIIAEADARIAELEAALRCEALGPCLCGDDWVSVEDRLPHPDDYVYVSTRLGIHEAWFGHDGVWRLRGDTDTRLPEVTHWLPLSAIPLPRAALKGEG